MLQQNASKLQKKTWNMKTYLGIFKKNMYLFKFKSHCRFYAVCKPINFQKKKQEEKPYVEIILSLFIGMVLQFPRTVIFEFEECCLLRNLTNIAVSKKLGKMFNP